MTIHEQLEKVCYDISGHYSDIYVPVNDATKKIIDGYEYRQNVTVFISQIDNQPWYDIPFANDDYKRGVK